MGDSCASRFVFSRGPRARPTSAASAARAPRRWRSLYLSPGSHRSAAGRTQEPQEDYPSELGDLARVRASKSVAQGRLEAEGAKRATAAPNLERVVTKSALKTTGSASSSSASGVAPVGAPVAKVANKAMFYSGVLCILRACAS